MLRIVIKTTSPQIAMPALGRSVHCILKMTLVFYLIKSRVSIPGDRTSPDYCPRRRRESARIRRRPADNCK